MGIQDKASTVGPYELPQAALDTLKQPGLKLVLHCISFSHYCERARWALRLTGLQWEEVSYLPMLHVPGILRLQRQFKQGPGQPTASSRSPAATPVLAIYSPSGEPICLLQDSALISRYAVLRAAALGLTGATQLYQTPLTVEAPSGPTGSEGTGAAATGKAKCCVAGEDPTVKDLELRLSGTMGVEVRRVMYFYLLPLRQAGGLQFSRNYHSSFLAWLAYAISRLLLPRLLRINKTTADKGRQLLDSEFAYFDQLLEGRRQQWEQKQGAAGGAEGSKSEGKLRYYLTGDHITAADVSLACLAGPILGVSAEHSRVWYPPIDMLPEELTSFMKELRERPTGKFVLELWRVHGPLSAASTSSSKL